MKEPAPIKKQSAEADKLYREFSEKYENQRFRKKIRITHASGRLRQRVVERPHAGIIANSKSELDQLLLWHVEAVGEKMRGNKRIGATALYADLIQSFQFLHRKGITLPRNKSLSARAFHYGLGEILRRHKYTDLSDSELIANRAERQKIANKMDRIFTHVATVIRNTPA